VFFTHKIFSKQGSASQPAHFPLKRFLAAGFAVGGQAGSLPYIRGNKKAPTHDEKGRQNGCATLLIFPRLMVPKLELAPVIETKVQPVAVVSSGQSLNHSS
jgi:hypothetical protein